MAMTLISTVTVGSTSVSSIDFSNIPQTGKSIYVVFQTRADAGYTYGKVFFNGDTTDGNYNRNSMRGSGSGATYIDEAVPRFGVAVDSTRTANTFSTNTMLIDGYTKSAYKTCLVEQFTEGNVTSGVSELVGGVWKNNAAITSLSIQIPGANFVQHSFASLYIIS